MVQSSRRRGVRWLAFGILAALLANCASPAQIEQSRRAWETHDLDRARGCGGAFMAGTCVSNGGGQ